MPTSRSLALPLLALLALRPLPAAAPTPRQETRIADLMRLGEVPGLGLAFVENGAPVCTRTYGVADATTHRPLDDRTIFNAASLSKQVFTYAVLKLVDQGQLDLDTPLTHYLPKRIIEGDPRLDLITARLVLSHRTGLPNGHRRPEDLVIHFTPGTQFSYSADGFVYLQHVLEHLTGHPLNQIVEDLVFTPLGMKDSSFLWRPDYDARAALGHDADGRPIPIAATRTTQANAAATLSTTLGDYARFMQAILAGAGLKPRTLRAMETPQVAVNPDCANCIAMAPDQTPLPPKEPSKVIFWGLGWGLEQTPQGRILWQWGDNEVHRNFVALNLDTHTGLAMFTNSENGLSIAPALFKELTGIDHPAFAWLRYDPYDAPAPRFLHAVRDHGLTAATKAFEAQLKAGLIPEATLNLLGYRLLTHDHPEAIRAFLLNVQLHPSSANAYDSLAEAYLTDGQKAQAIRNYRQSLALDPRNDNAARMLTKLQQP